MAVIVEVREALPERPPPTGVVVAFSWTEFLVMRAVVRDAFINKSKHEVSAAVERMELAFRSKRPHAHLRVAPEIAALAVANILSATAMTYDGSGTD